MKLVIALVTLLTLVTATLPAHAQTSSPTKPVELVVAYAPGGAADVAARLIAGYASKKWAQPVDAVNLPGAPASPARRTSSTTKMGIRK